MRNGESISPRIVIFDFSLLFVFCIEVMCTIVWEGTGTALFIRFGNSLALSQPHSLHSDFVITYQLSLHRKLPFIYLNAVVDYHKKCYSALYRIRGFSEVA